MSRVPKDVSKRQRVPPRRNDSPPQEGEVHSPEDGGAVQRARTPPWEKDAEGQATGGASFGTWLRRQREARGIVLREIADRTKISYRYLEAMEDDRFDLLPAPLFAKGFLREYARYVGLNPDEVVNHWISVQKPDEPEDLETTLIGKVARRGRSAQKGRGWAFYFFFILAGLLLLGLVALFAYYNEKRQEDPAVRQPPPIAAPPAAPAPVQTQLPPSPPPEEPSAPIELTLDFIRNCWVEAVIDGRPHTAEERVQGESLELEAQESIDLKLGDAGAVTVQVNGRPMALREGPGQIARLRIDLETVRTLQQSPQGPQATGNR
jgi:cytoskeleton protein RodZ